MGVQRQPTFEGQQLLADIGARAFAEFEHGISVDEFDQLVAVYADFTTAHPDPDISTMDQMLPRIDDPYILGKSLDELDRARDTQKIWHKYRTNTEKLSKPDGYTNRFLLEHVLLRARGIQLDPPEDDKEFYHYSPSALDQITHNHAIYGWGPIPKEVIRLNSAFESIHTKAMALMIRVCGLIEETHPEINSFITEDALRDSPVRLLFYHPSTIPQRGAGHYDKSALTAQLAESHRGLRIAPHEGSDLVDVVRDSSSAALFPGSALAEHFPESPFLPAWHDIISSQILNEGRRIPPNAESVCARWAIIFFANYVNFANPDKSRMHTR